MTRPNRSGRHRGSGTDPAVRLGVSIAALLAAFGAGVAILPASVTGSGMSAETPEAAIAALAPGAGGGAPGAGTPAPSAPSSSAPAASAPVSAAPKAATTPEPRAPATKAARKASTPKPRATSATTRAVTGLAAEETEVIRLVNVERRAAGCDTVELDTRLRTAMRLHVQELGTHGNLYISHVSDDGRSFTDRARAQGYNNPGGENVARGQRNAAAVMDSWMNSQGHRANILNCSFVAIGVGAVRGVDGTIVWGQLFGR